MLVDKEVKTRAGKGFLSLFGCTKYVACPVLRRPLRAIFVSSIRLIGYDEPNRWRSVALRGRYNGILVPGACEQLPAGRRKSIKASSYRIGSRNTNVSFNP